ncbi:MAG: hypothetical protein KGH49_02820 [Candidatus Micrarchaeota archaeon]|nr:hypothetical protein [Candidatus Micrarchaeota archaeon]
MFGEHKTFYRVVAEFLVGLVVSYIIADFVSFILLGLQAALFAIIGEIILTMVMVYFLPFVGIGFILGTLYGLYSFLTNGTISLLQFVIFAVAVLIVFAIRLIDPFKDLK